jgi:hypothetical protein
MADDLGFQLSAPSADNFGFQPAPQVPDMSGVQKTAQQNMMPEAPKEGEEVKPNPPQSPSQQLDKAMGFSVSSTLKGENQTTPLPAPMREHLINAYKDGSTQGPGDFFQSALLATAPIAVGVMNQLEHPLDSLLNVGKNIAGGVEAGVQNLKNFATMADLPTPVTNEIEAKIRAGQPVNWKDYLGEFNEKFTNSPGGQAMGAVFNPILGAVAPAFDTATKTLENAGIPHQVTQFLMNVSPAFGLLKGHPLESTSFPEGTGPWDRVQGADAMKQIVGEHLEKLPESVTSSDIDNTIHKGTKNIAPQATDFENTSKIMFGDNKAVDSLQDIYKQTGVRPDQVFEDAKRDPETMAAVQEGRIPPIYDHLIDRRPPIPADIQAAIDRAQTWEPTKGPTQLSPEGASTSNNPLGCRNLHAIWQLHYVKGEGQRIVT